MDYLITKRNEIMDKDPNQKEVPVVRMYGVNDNGEPNAFQPLDAIPESSSIQWRKQEERCISAPLCCEA